MSKHDFFNPKKEKLLKEKTSTVDVGVDHPQHYNSGKLFEVIDVICDQGFGEGFCLGNALKYIMRAKHKENYTQDLNKAKWYLDYWINFQRK